MYPKVTKSRKTIFTKLVLLILLLTNLITLISLLLSSDTPSPHFENVEISKNYSEISKQKKLYKVTKVIDGETLIIYDQDFHFQVKLIGIDGPDMIDYSKDYLGECYSIASQTFLEKLLLDKNVYLKKSEGEAFGEFYVYRADDSLNINKEILLNGYAKVDMGVAFKLKKSNRIELYDAENQAKEKSLGVWSERCYCTNDEDVFLNFAINKLKENSDKETYTLSGASYYIYKSPTLSQKNETAITILNTPCHQNTVKIYPLQNIKNEWSVINEEIHEFTIEQPLIYDVRNLQIWIQIKDVNFDNQEDILLLSWMGATGNVGYKLYLNKLDNESKLLEIREFEELSQACIDDKKEILHSHLNGGCAGASFAHTLYKWEKDELIPVKKITQECPTDIENIQFPIKKYEYKNERFELIERYNSLESYDAWYNECKSILID